MNDTLKKRNHDVRLAKAAVDLEAQRRGETPAGMLWLITHSQLCWLLVLAPAPLGFEPLRREQGHTCLPGSIPALTNARLVSQSAP